MKRREFIKTTALAAAGTTLAACAGSNGKVEQQRVGIEAIGNVTSHFDGVGLLGYGCMRWPQIQDADGKEVIDQEAVNALVDEALAHGVNYFDTSPVYLEGDSERATAEALNRHPREKWLLATKLSAFRNCDYDNCVLMYRKSLEIFKTDHIDYYLLHSLKDGADFSKRFGTTGIMTFLLAERAKGSIRNLGFSFHGTVEGLEQLLALHDIYHWDFVQIQMNYQDWNHAGGRNGNASELYAMLESRGIPVVIMEPLRGGSLADIPASLADKLKSREPSQSIASWAFRFAGAFPGVMTVLSGMTYKEHLEDNIRTYADLKPLSDEDLALLDSIAADIANAPLIGCTGCQYCMPCPYGIDIPGIFRFYNRNVNEDTYVKSKEQKDYARARRRYLASYDKTVQSVRQADHCISCGKCVKACPQHIRIPKELRRIDEYVEALKQGTLE